MSFTALTHALEQLPDPSFVEGTTPFTERFAIALPDGDVGALDDEEFITWLLEHAENAPFGDGHETRYDATVRRAKRLVARGAAKVVGFDPASVLPAIEAALSPRFHLDARLEDIIVYEAGGMFARHKDTPRTANLVGTLVVGLPIAHTGGRFTIIDGGTQHVVDWSGAPIEDSVRWVALFSDLDHVVERVESGERVTLVYSLSRSDRPRAVAPAQLAPVRAAIDSVKLAPAEPLLIACTRQIVTDGTQPQSIDTLRGTDREIAEAFREAGFAVAVRACIAADDADEPSRFPPHVFRITRLARTIPADVIANITGGVSFTDEIDLSDYGGNDGRGTTLGEYVLDRVLFERWVIRKRAAATMIYDGLYSETGYFGNEAHWGHVYSLAAIEVTAAS